MFKKDPKIQERCSKMIKTFKASKAIITFIPFCENQIP